MIDIKQKTEALLKRNGEIFLAHHNGDNYYSEKYTQKLESIVRASVGLVEQLNSVIETSACLPGRKRSIKETLAQFAAEVERVGK